MADVQWIKLHTAMFDNSKIKYIRTLPEGNNIVLIWVMILAKAGKCNSNGFIFLTENIPYTPKMLAAEFDFDSNIIELALRTFNNLDMIHLEESKIMVTGWNEHQNVEGLEKIREKSRKRVAKYRANQKLIESNVTGNVTVTDSNAIEEDIDIDIDIEEDIDINNISKDILSSTLVQRIIEKWNSLNLTSKLTKINNGTNRYKMLKARVKEYGEDQVFKAIEEIEKSKFLKGQATEFEITFDWFIKPNRFSRVLEGNYRDKVGESNGNGIQGTGKNSSESKGKYSKYNFDK